VLYEAISSNRKKIDGNAQPGFVISGPERLCRTIPPMQVLK
jgi:hypothetical protein